MPHTISQPESAGRGTLKGVELAYQQFYDFLPGALSGLGLQLNYTRITGSTQAPLTFGGTAVKKNNANAVLMYEKCGISGRLACNYRGKFVDSFNPGGVQTPAYNVIKAQQPVLKKAPANSVYATGHNGFFTSPDGRENWIVFHANPGPDMKCTARRAPSASPSMRRVVRRSVSRCPSAGQCRSHPRMVPDDDRAAGRCPIVTGGLASLKIRRSDVFRLRGCRRREPAARLCEIRWRARPAMRDGGVPLGERPR